MGLEFKPWQSGLGPELWTLLCPTLLADLDAALFPLSGSRSPLLPAVAIAGTAPERTGRDTAALLEERVWALWGAAGPQRQTLCHADPTSSHLPSLPAEPSSGGKNLLQPQGWIMIGLHWFLFPLPHTQLPLQPRSSCDWVLAKEMQRQVC